MDKDICELAQRAIREKVFPGCVIGVVRVGERSIYPFGSIRYGGEPVREDTVYDLASITKSVPLASLVMILVEEKVVQLNDLVRTWIPELQNDHAATIEDLLRYRVRGVRLSELAHLSPREITQSVFASGFADLPGEEKYSNLPAFLLGIILERASGKRLDVLAHERLFLPLAMSTTGFSIRGAYSDIAAYHCVAPTERVAGEDVCGIVHDESARAFAHEGRAVGHAGLFSCAHDLANFLECILAGGYPEIVRGAHKGLGWELNRGWFMGTRFGPRTFGKTGFTGTSIVCDTDRRRAVIILSNRTYPTRPADSAAINAFRSSIVDTVFLGSES